MRNRKFEESATQNLALKGMVNHWVVAEATTGNSRGKMPFGQLNTGRRSKSLCQKLLLGQPNLIGNIMSGVYNPVKSPSAPDPGELLAHVDA
jgi:hypothetical protein